MRSTVFFSLFLLSGLLSAENEVIRIMAANLSSGNRQNYEPGHGNRIFQGLKPQIVLIQESNYGANTSASYRQWIDETFGKNFQYFVEPTEAIPNGIISAYPILASGEWPDTQVPNRDYVWARIDIPGEHDLWAVSVHLYSKKSTGRAIEAQEIKDFLKAANIPATDYIVIGGDFNTDNRSEPCIANFSSVFVTAGPFPADQAGNDSTNAKRSKPYDWVLASPTLDALKTPLVIGATTFEHGLVFDTRVFAPLSAVTPALLGDSAAPGMQHMAVVRAFSIPTAKPPAPVKLTPAK